MRPKALLFTGFWLTCAALIWASTPRVRASSDPVMGSNLALIILRSTQCSQTIHALESAGAHAVHVLSAGAIIAVVPPQVEPAVRGISEVAMVTRGQVISTASVGPETSSAIRVWNSLLAFGPEAVGDTGPPLIGDAFMPPQPVGAAGKSSSSAPATNQTSEFMIGKIAVGVILPESIGGSENWDTERQDMVFSKIVAGLNWWAIRGGAAAHLTFYYDKRFGVPTQYEPIEMSGVADEPIWVGDIFANMGYATGDIFSRGRAYDNDIRAGFAADWAFSCIVVDSRNDSDGKFGDGKYFAWSNFGGPYLIMTYKNGGWGISRMDDVLAHETGHIFLAADEYCSPGYYCCDFGYYGYLNIRNSNCESGNPGSISCVMRGVDDALCSYTSDQVGWCDTDADGKPDPIDNQVTNILNPALINGSRAGFTGSARDNPCDSPSRAEVTINKISSVRYRLDAGPWNDAAADDGAFDRDTETYRFTTPALSLGSHYVETQAFSTSGNASPIAGQSVQISETSTLTFTPASGTYHSPIDVEIACSTLGAIIRFTTDGSEPSETSALYASPVHIARTTILNARSWVNLVPGVIESAAYRFPISISGAKAMADGTLVAIDQAVVTAVFGDLFYIESENRSLGIAAGAPWPGLQPGMKLDILGVALTNGSGERWIQIKTTPAY